jgi:hypothetical protein
MERVYIGLEETATMLDVCEKTVRRLSEDNEIGPIVKIRGSTKLIFRNVKAYMERIEAAARKKYQFIESRA